MEGIGVPAILNEINWLDIVFVILFLGMVYKGARTGVGSQILSLAGWFVLLFVSIGYYSFLSEAIFGFMLQAWAKPVSFFVISAAMFTVIKFLERVFNVISGEEIASIEKIGGVLVAALRASIFCGIIAILLLLVPLEYTRISVTEGSKTAMFFVDLDSRIYSWMTSVTGLPKKADKDDVINGFLTATGGQKK